MQYNICKWPTQHMFMLQIPRWSDFVTYLCCSYYDELILPHVDVAATTMSWFYCMLILYSSYHDELILPHVDVAATTMSRFYRMLMLQLPRWADFTACSCCSYHDELILQHVDVAATTMICFDPMLMLQLPWWTVRGPGDTTDEAASVQGQD